MSVPSIVLLLASSLCLAAATSSYDCAYRSFQGDTIDVVFDCEDSAWFAIFIAWTGAVTILFALIALFRSTILHVLDKRRKRRAAADVETAIPATTMMGAAEGVTAGAVPATPYATGAASTGTAPLVRGGSRQIITAAGAPATGGMLPSGGRYVELGDLMVLQPRGARLTPQFKLGGGRTDYTLQLPISYGQAANLMIALKPVTKTGPGAATAAAGVAAGGDGVAELAIRIGPETSEFERVPMGTMSGSFVIPISGEQLPFDMEVLLREAGFTQGPLTVYRIAVVGLTTTIMEPL